MDAGQTMTFTGLLAICVLLIAFAREYWWIALFVAIGFGGYAYYGFKIYAHECLLALALTGLIPSIAMKPHSEFALHRPKLPWFFFATLAYLGLHIFYSIATNNPHGFIEIGNILRAYMYGIWPLIFVFFFRWYGRSDYLPFALYLLQGIYLFRGLLTLSTLFFPMTSVLPGINFMLPGNTMNAGGLDDLRFVGHGICVVACAILIGRRTPGTLIYQGLLLAFAAVALLMGGGRGMLVASIVVVIAAIAAARMWKTLFVVGTCAALFLTFLNLFPKSIYVLDFRMQRALSILIINPEATDIHRLMNTSSNLYHERIKREGYDRWTSSPRAFTIGTGIRPWNPTILRETNITLLTEGMIQGSADVGNYETAIWTILAPTGIVGMILYSLTLGYFALANLKRLRREDLRGIERTIGFVGCYPALEWFLFSPAIGGYPQIEMLFAATAFYYFADRRITGLRSTEVSSDDEGSIYSEASRA